MRKLLLVVAMLVGCMGGASESHAQFCPGVSPWVFDDVLASDPFCGFITRMAQQNVTLGCIVIDANHRLYCPDDSVTRKQMAAFMARLGDALFPLTCAAGQVMKWNGSAWACANDSTGGGGGGGTVTSVLAGTGLQGSPNPITGSGSLNLAPGYQLPQACSNGQVPKSNGSGGWACAADAVGVGTVTAITAGTGLTGGTITGSGTVAVDTAYVQRRVSATCAVGSSIRAIAADGSVTCQVDNAGPANAFVQGGNAFAADAVLGTTDASRAVNVMAANARVMRYEPNATSPNLLGGHPNNGVGAFAGQTVAGGGAAGNTCYDPPTATFTRSCGNRTSGDHATVGGGRGNIAGGPHAMVAGGATNSASGALSTVGGGADNTALGTLSTVVGGLGNVASGSTATVVGGEFNSATGMLSQAGGRYANANHSGCYVWGDSSTTNTISCNAADRYVVRSLGGVFFFAGGNTQASYTGVVLPPGATAWVAGSDRNIKDNISAVDTGEVLARLVALPIASWNLKAQDASIRHMGPMAQDFRAAFGLGESEVGINTIDADGVALAAIQGLNAKLEAQVAEQARLLADERAARQAQAAEIAERLTQTESLRGELAALRSMLAALLEARKQVADAW